MILGIGTDLVDSRRVERLLDVHGQRFLMRVFTPIEQRYCLRQKTPSLALAKRFAAKEAFAKALGWGIGHQLGWRDVGIESGARGQPELVVSLSAHERIAQALGAFSVKVSLSDETPYAMAFVIISTAFPQSIPIGPLGN